ncbi:MAG: quinoprotein dehydrogenase-associated SoxYZ-like carrier [Pararhizobium sp.]
MNGFKYVSRLIGATLAVGLLAGSALAETSADNPWPDIRISLYGENATIGDGAGVIALDAPARAVDAAVVPISIKADMKQTPDHYIRKITLVIDQNPAPVVGTFHLYPANGIASVSTRVRVDAYTMVRAIAETNDGKLYMAKSFVKATGGCSAPATSDNDAALSRLGKMKLKQIGTWTKGQPDEAQFMVSHPNYSGMQINQLTRLWIPARYVKSIDLSLDGKPILRFDGDISVSENPTIRFYVKPQGEGVLHAKVVDSKGTTFEHDWPITLEPAT